MRTIRSIAIAGCILGILFKTLHWPGASIILLTSGVRALMALGRPLFRWPGPMTVQLRYPAMLIGAVMAVIAGGLFKTMHWPGASMLLMCSLLACSLWFLLPQGRRPGEA